MLKRLTKAAVAVALSPMAAVADAVMMPADAVEDREFAPRTSALLRAAGENALQAVEPEEREEA